MIPFLLIISPHHNILFIQSSSKKILKKKMISWFEKHSKISLTITIIIAITIFYISSLAFPSGSHGTSLKATLYHLTAFFALALALQVTLIKRKNTKLIPIVIAMLILYAISDELHQFLVPGRACSLIDIFTDIVGITFAFLIYLIIILKSKIKQQI